MAFLTLQYVIDEKDTTSHVWSGINNSFAIDSDYSPRR